MAYHYVIDQERCKGCGLCVTVCPKEVLEISSRVSAKGYFPAYQARPEKCIYCATCCRMCPDVAITITETSEDTVAEQMTEESNG
jgi:2-oxoglutarate ferredoxin oxidoreductase subunit delta